MPPKKGKNKKKNSLPATPKENGDVDPLNSVAETPADEKDLVFSTPADRLDNPLDVPVANGAFSNPPNENGEAISSEAMAKAEGDEATGAWGLDGDTEKSKVITEEPENVDTAAQSEAIEKADAGPEEFQEEFKPRDLDSELAKAEVPDAEPETESVVPPVVTAEEEGGEKLTIEAATEADPEATKLEELPTEIQGEENVPTEEAPVDVPDTAEANEPVLEEPPIVTADTVDAENEVKAEEPDTVKEETTEAITETEPVVDSADPVPEDEPAAEATTEPPAAPAREILPPPKPSTLNSLTSSDRDFTSTRYQSTASPQFLNKPHQAANHSLDLDDRNMQSSVINWYKKINSFSESLNWRPGWDFLEEFDQLVAATEAPLAQISLLPAREYWAEKPKDSQVNWENLDGKDLKYEEFWEWKSKLALSAFCVNFACREIFGKTVFAVDDKMIKKLGTAMFVFSKDLDDDVTATKFRHMTLKLLQESPAFKRATRKQLVFLSEELANILSPLSTLMPPPAPKPEEDQHQQSPYSPFMLALYEKVLSATLTLHDTIQKDHKYFSLFHPVPGGEFDEMTMEEATFDGIGAEKGAVALVVRPGLARLGLPKGGEPEDIIIVHKALVVREGALEEPLIVLSAEEPPVEEHPATTE